MMLIRLIIFVVLVSLVIMIYRRLTAPSKQTSTITNASMKKCAHCGVHMPESDAIEKENLFFCSEEHLKLYHDPENND